MKSGDILFNMGFCVFIGRYFDVRLFPEIPASNCPTAHLAAHMSMDMKHQ